MNGKYGNLKSAIRILLLEDNPNDVQLIKEMLAEAKDMQFDIEFIDRLSTGLILLSEEAPLLSNYRWKKIEV